MPSHRRKNTLTEAYIVGNLAWVAFSPAYFEFLARRRYRWNLITHLEFAILNPLLKNLFELAVESHAHVLHDLLALILA